MAVVERGTTRRAWCGFGAAGGLRGLTSIAVAVMLVLGSTGPAFAARDEDEGEPREIPQIEPGGLADDAPPGENADAVRKAYMTLLFQEINVRRDQAATPRYEYMADAGSEAVNAYLRDLLPAMEAARTCFHGSDWPGM